MDQNAMVSQPLIESSSWKTYWRQAFAIKGSITPHVLPNVLCVGILTALICTACEVIEHYFHVRATLSVTPYEFTGAALGLLLVLRTNAGYDRWWEARKLWGGIVNQSRNLAISALTYGPANERWRTEFITWTAAFSHASRLHLRRQQPDESLKQLLGEDACRTLSAAQHMPSAVAVRLASLLREACTEHNMDSFAFMQIDRERALLIDHIGACERIQSTPLALAYSIKIRRFIAIFLFTLPFALMHSLNSVWLVPPLVMLIAYPLFSLDQLGVELQDPFNQHNLSHLPLDGICANIGRNVLSLLAAATQKTSDAAEQIHAVPLCATKNDGVLAMTADTATTT